MKIAIIVCLSICSALISGCGATSAPQHKQLHANNVAATKTEIVTENTQIATPEPKNIAPETILESPKPIVRHVVALPAPIQPTETVVAIETPAPTPTAPPVQTVAAPKNNWIPNEVHLIRGNELISGLQRDIGRKPTPLEMQQRLQTHMGLSASQANQVIATLGLQ